MAIISGTSLHLSHAQQEQQKLHDIKTLPCCQGTFLPTTVAADLDAMAAHDELNEAAKAIRERMSALKAQDTEASTSLGEAGRRGSLRRSQSISAAERHMANFRHIVEARSLSPLQGNSVMIGGEHSCMSAPAMIKKIPVGNLLDEQRCWHILPWTPSCVL